MSREKRSDHVFIRIATNMAAVCFLPTRPGLTTTLPPKQPVKDEKAFLLLDRVSLSPAFCGFAPAPCSACQRVEEAGLLPYIRVCRHVQHHVPVLQKLLAADDATVRPVFDFSVCPTVFVGPRVLPHPLASDRSTALDPLNHLWAGITGCPPAPRSLTRNKQFVCPEFS
jgi:hypothetical protein